MYLILTPSFCFFQSQYKELCNGFISLSVPSFSFPFYFLLRSKNLKSYCNVVQVDLNRWRIREGLKKVRNSQVSWVNYQFNMSKPPPAFLNSMLAIKRKNQNFQKVDWVEKNHFQTKTNRLPKCLKPYYKVFGCYKEILFKSVFINLGYFWILNFFRALFIKINFCQWTS